ncbi:MAG: NAD(P)-dependent alcohol dehydrogenase [Sandaracinus sp.]
MESASVALAPSFQALPAVSTMRALVQHRYGGPEVLVLSEIPCPAPGPGEVRVRVEAAGLDRGTWHLMTGRPYLMRLLGFGFFGPKQAIAGLDLTGTVEALGAGVTRFAVGDRVFGIGKGSFAEHAIAREDKLARVPASVRGAEAALFGVSAITAMQALDRAALRSGERVLIIGASGGVGSFAVQMAHARGARVTGVCRTEKVALVASLGAERVVDYTRESFTDGRERYDVVIDAGGNTPTSALRRAMTEEGRLVFVGGENGDSLTGGMGRPLGAMLLGAFTRQRFFMLANREHYEYLERVAALVDRGELRAVVDRRCGLAEVPQALADLEAGRVRGKVLVEIR